MFATIVLEIRDIRVLLAIALQPQASQPQAPYSVAAGAISSGIAPDNSRIWAMPTRIIRTLMERRLYVI